MIDGEAVIQQSLQGSAPPNWRVLPAKVSHFLGSIAGYAIGAVLLLAFIGFLAVNPDARVTLQGSSSDAPNVIQFWRTIDFVVAGVMALACVALLVLGVRGLGTVKQQALVVLPEGFVMQKGTDKKTLSVIEFGAITGIATSVSNGNWTLVIPRANGKGVIKLALDGRFGAPKQIAKMLEEARSQFAIANIRR